MEGSDRGVHIGLLGEQLPGTFETDHGVLTTTPSHTPRRRASFVYHAAGGDGQRHSGFERGLRSAPATTWTGRPRASFAEAEAVHRGRPSVLGAGRQDLEFEVTAPELERIFFSLDNSEP